MTGLGLAIGSVIAGIAYFVRRVLWDVVRRWFL